MLRDLSQDSERYRLLINSLALGVIFQDTNGHVIEINSAAKNILGVRQLTQGSQSDVGNWFYPISPDGLPFKLEDHPVSRAIEKRKPVNNIIMGIIHPRKKTKLWLSVNVLPQYDSEGIELLHIVSTFSDITLQQIADEAASVHLRFLNSMERVSRIFVSALSINDMLSSVLEEMLSIFDCSRAWFLYPCDTSSKTWNIPLTRTRPEWPGAEVGVEMPMIDDVINIIERCKKTDGPVIFNVNTDERFRSGSVIIQYNIQSQLIIKLAPKVGLPWILGIHHCESPRIYSDADKELFTEISRRIADSLSTLITLKNLKSSEEKFRTLVEHAPEAILVFDVEKNIFNEINENAVQLFKKNRENLRKENFLSLSPEYQPNDAFSLEIMKKYIALTVGGEAPVFDWIFCDANEKMIPCEVRLVRLPDSKSLLIRCSITNISERVKAQEHLQHLAHHDALTQLPNRIMLVERLESAIIRAKRNKEMVAILFLDIDHFKVINDTLGHDIGDKSLQKIASILDSNLRSTDTVARFGGDEFVVLLEGVTNRSEIIPVISNLLSAITVSMVFEGHEIFISTSIGISLFPIDSDNVTTLLKYADVAMYRAKDRGRNTYEFYSSEMSLKASERLRLETRLRRAVQKKEFTLVYQPQIDVNSNRIVGAEALMRWHPDGLDPIPPDIFIPLLEEIGLISKAGEWVLDTALSQLKCLDKLVSGFKMSINLSSRQFQNANLIQILEQAIDRHQINPQQVELEITESLLMEHHHITFSMLSQISELGFHLSIDDFGTGYSSLSYLKQLPIDTLKIDRSFIRDIPTDPDDEAIIIAIIALAKSLKLKLIAEGVENEAQYQFIKNNRCKVAQGYYFSEPLSEDNLSRLLLTDPCST